MDISKKDNYLIELTAIGGKVYTLDVLYDLFTTCKDDLSQFASRYKLKLSELRRFAEAQKWEEDRINLKKSSRQQLLKRIDKSAKIQAELELKIQALEAIKMEQQVEFLMQYYAQHGDLYVRNPQTGDVMYDNSGQPKMMQVPTSSNDVQKRKGLAELLQGYKKILKLQELEQPSNGNETAIEFLGDEDIEAQKLLNMAKNSDE